MHIMRSLSNDNCALITSEGRPCLMPLIWLKSKSKIIKILDISDLAGGHTKLNDYQNLFQG